MPVVGVSFLIGMISEYFIKFSGIKILFKSLFTVLFVLKSSLFYFFEIIVNERVFKKIGICIGIVFNTLLLGMMSVNGFIVPSMGCILLLGALLFVYILTIKKSKDGKN